MQSIKLNPSHALAYYNRGIAYYDRREFDRASQDLNQAIKLNPNYAGAFHDRGITNYNRRDFDAAIPSGDVPLVRTTRSQPTTAPAPTRTSATTTV